MKFNPLISILALSTLSPLWAASQAVVIVPVADLRSEPSLPPLGLSDDKQQTQLLFGETVEVVSSSGEWVQINAIEQPSFKYHQRWEGYPGWVLKSEVHSYENKVERDEKIVIEKWLPVSGAEYNRLPLGSRVHILRVIPYSGMQTKSMLGDGEFDLFNGHTARAPLRGLRILEGIPLREQILWVASSLIGDPYIWGGLTPFDETHKTRLSGIDCSGLVHLAYRVNGMTVPRDSIDQYRMAKKIKRRDLQAADLIFSANLDKPKKIVHVMLYAGGDDVIEAPRTGETVHRTTFKAKTGVPLSTVESGQKLKDRVVYFGRLLKD